MKNCEEWSLEFDLLYQNITSNQAPGLTEYEKSVFLTRAEQAVVTMLYNGTLRSSFEETEEFTHFLAPLVMQASCPDVSSSMPHVVAGSQVFELPEDLLFRTLELCRVDVPNCGIMDALVVPVTQDEFWRTSRNPFKKQNSRRVLRLTLGESGEFSSGMVTVGYSELVSDNPVEEYVVRYVKKPDPIILVDLNDGTSIDGKTEAATCKLPEAIHQTILSEAVNAAKAVWKS